MQTSHLFDVLLKQCHPTVPLPPSLRLKEVEGKCKMLEVLLLRATNNFSIS